MLLLRVSFLPTVVAAESLLVRGDVVVVLGAITVESVCVAFCCCRGRSAYWWLQLL